MLQTSTALIALNPILNTAQLHSILNNLRLQVTNKATINTKESIITELLNFKPTFLFISSALPGTISLEEAIVKSKQISPKTKVVLIVTENDSTRAVNYLLANVDAIVYAENLFESLEFLVKQLTKGEVFVCGKTVLDFKISLQQIKLETKLESGLLELLTDRETEVLHSLTQGINYKQIAKMLFISESTVKTHINNIFTKLNVNDRTQAVLYALNHGIENLLKKPHLLKNEKHFSPPSEPRTRNLQVL